MKEKKNLYPTCPIRQVVSRFSNKWSLLVLYELHQNTTGTMRFSELNRSIPDCSQKMLSQTLKNLESCHLVHRKLYPEVPPRVEYSLTPVGQSLMPNLDILLAWAETHFDTVTAGENR
jgi:transcriptional regulator, MarR family